LARSGLAGAGVDVGDGGGDPPCVQPAPQGGRSACNHGGGGALGLVTITYVTHEKSGEQQAGGDLAYADVQPILAKHCVTCHAPHPTNPAFAAPPLGVLLDTGEHASAAAPRIKKVAVDAQVMPLGNMTNMTLEERQKLGAWIAAGAKP
jgi:uncharacterized membrane protein